MSDVVRLADHHHTHAFSCGTPFLDDFLRNEAYRAEEDYGTTWVIVPEASASEVIAYYTLNYPYELGDQDDDAVAMPALELSCLAVDMRHQFQGVGTNILRGLIDLILKSQDKYPIDLLLLVAISPQAKAWYLSRGLGFQVSAAPACYRLTLARKGVCFARIFLATYGVR